MFWAEGRAYTKPQRTEGTWSIKEFTEFKVDCMYQERQTRGEEDRARSDFQCLKPEKLDTSCWKKIFICKLGS